MGKIIGLTFPKEEAVKKPLLPEKKARKRETAPKKARKTEV